jgi:hypothetical protein
VLTLFVSPKGGDVQLLNKARFLIAATAVAVVCTTATLSVALGSGAAATAEDEQPSVVEDFGYPGADEILSDYHVQLLTGDGHILFVTCPAGSDTVGLIQVRTSELVGQANDGRVCFHVIAATGHLSMKIPAVYSIRGDGLTQGQGHKIRAELTTDSGQHSTIDVNPSGTTQVGVGANPPGAPTTLLQLDTSS